MEIEEVFFKIGSCLTDPVCLAHEHFYRIQVVSSLAKKVFFLLSAFVFAFVSLFTSVPGIAFRGVACWLQEKPYLSEVHGEGIELPENRAFSLFSWNICCVAGGYTITDGGVAPWRDRIDPVIKKIVETDSDVNCLYELFDYEAASLVKERLKEAGYTHFYYNIGPQAIGVSSGILVASKYEIQNPEWTLFPKESLVGRTKHANKGIFSFDLVSCAKPFARIYSTHLQHSELPEFPTEEEVLARKAQMEIAIDKISKLRDRCLVFTGDLNCEINPFENGFVKSDLFLEKTWGGDAFCAKLTGKPISGPLNLDHTMIWRGTGKKIESVLVAAGYFAQYYLPHALSDHNGILSRVFLN